MSSAKELNAKGGRNRFKFSSFAEQLGSIDVDVFHSIVTVNKTGFIGSDGPDHLSFKTSLLEWRELNCTSKFAEMFFILEKWSKSLELLTFHSHDISSVLCSAISDNSDFSADEPVFHLISCFARDLRSEFLQFFADILIAMVSRLKQLQDARIIEIAFRSIGFIFKYLSKDIASRFVNVVDLMIPILIDRHDHIRWFSCPSIAFILRKMDDSNFFVSFEYLFNCILNSSNPSILADSIADIIFEYSRGPQSTLHSKYQRIVKFIFNNRILAFNKYQLDVVENSIVKICHHADSGNSLLIHNLVLNWAREEKANEIKFGTICRIILAIVLSQHGDSPYIEISTFLNEFVMEFDIQEQAVFEKFSSLYSVLFYSITPQNYSSARSILTVCLDKYPIKLTGILVKKLLALAWASAESILLPLLVSKLSECNAENMSEIVSLIVFCKFKIGKTGFEDRLSIDSPPLAEFVENQLLSERYRMEVAFSALRHFKIFHQQKSLELLSRFIRAADPSSWELYHALSVFTMYKYQGPSSTSEDVEAISQSLFIEFGKNPGNISVLASLALLSEHWDSNILSTLASDTRFVGLLIRHIKSPYKFIRQSALRILGHVCTDSQSLIQFILEIDNDFAIDSTSRSFVINLSKLSSNFVEETIGEKDASIICQYALSLFSRNYQPVWKHAAEIILLLFQKHSVILWGIIFDEVQLYMSDLAMNSISTPVNVDKDSLDAFRRKFTIPKYLTQIDSMEDKIKCLNTCTILISEFFTNSYLCFEGKERFDTINYLTLLMKLLSENILAITEKNSQAMISLFFSLFPGKLDDIPNTVTCCRKKLIQFLTLFSRFKNPEKSLSFEHLSKLKEFCYQLLATGDNDYQKLAMDCLVRYTGSTCHRYHDLFCKLADPKTFKDSLTNLQFVLQENTCNELERQALMEIVLRFLFGKMTKASDDMQKVGLTRSFITNFISSCTKTEIRHFLDISVEKLQDISNYKRCIGFLNHLESIVKNFGILFLQNSDIVVPVLVNILTYAHNYVETGDQTNLFIDKFRLIRSLALKRLLEIAKSEASHGVVCLLLYMPNIMSGFLKDKINVISLDNVESPSTAFNLINFWAPNDTYAQYFYQNDMGLLKQTSLLLKNPKTKPSSILVGLEIIENSISKASADHIIGTSSDELFEILKDLPENNHEDFGVSIKFKRFSILKILSTNVKNKSQAESLLSLLVSNVRNFSKRTSHKEKSNVLAIFCNIFPTLESSQKQKIYQLYYPALCKILLTEADINIRKSIITAFEVLAIEFASLQLVYEFLRDLNSTDNVGSPDYEKRNEAMATICDSQIHSSLTTTEWRPLLYSFAHFMLHEQERSFVSYCSWGLTNFLVNAGNKEDYEEILSYTAIPLIKKIINGKSIIGREEIIQVLSKGAILLSSNSFFSPLKILVEGVNEENSFFGNLYHIQLHRRIKAIRELSDLFLSLKEFCSSTLHNVLIPLLLPIVFESEKKTHHQLIHDATLAIAAGSRHLEWNHYINLVRKVFKIISENTDDEKRNYRLISSVLQEFKWDMSDETSAISSSVEKWLLPHLYEQIRKIAKDDVITPNKVHLSIAYVKIVTYLPAEKRKLEISRILTVLCQALKSRALETRKIIRESLAKITLILGKDYINFVFKEMNDVLTKGYQLHVLGYSVNSLLHACATKFGTAYLDDSVHILTPIFLNDIFGDTGLEKEKEDLPKQMPETKASKSYESFEILCANISFEMLSQIMIYFRDLIISNSGSSFHGKMEMILSRMAIGLKDNAEIKIKDYLVFCKDIINRKGPIFDCTRVVRSELSKLEENFKVQSFERTESIFEKKRNHFLENISLFVEFGYNLIFSAIKYDRIDPQNSITGKIMDEFVAVASKDMLDSNAKISLSCLKILNQLSKKSRTSFMPFVDQISHQAYVFFNRGAESNDLRNSVLKLITSCIQNYKVVLSAAKTSNIIKSLWEDLEVPEKMSAAFSFLKSIICAEYPYAEIYDLVLKLTDLMVTSHTSSVREPARNVCLQFLKMYPLSKRKVDKYVSSLIGNLRYPHQSGRESTLEFLHMMITSFSPEFIENYAQIIFLNLILMIHDDKSEKCKEMASEVIKGLIKIVSNGKVTEFEQICLSWIRNESENLIQSGCQAIGIIVDGLVETSNQAWLQEHSIKMTEPLLYIFQRLQKTAISSWKTLYFCLNSLKKLLDTGNVPIQSFPWDDFCSLLKHEHEWIRIVTSRIFETMLRHLCDNPKDEKLLTDELKLSSNLISMIAEDHVSEDLAQTLATCLTLIIKMYSIKIADGHDLEDTSDKLEHLVKKLSIICRKMQNSYCKQKMCGYQVFAGMINTLPDNLLNNYLYYIMSPISRTIDDQTCQSEGFDMLKQMSQEIMRMIEKKIGSSQYLKIQSQVNTKIRETRDRRRSEQKILAKTNPEAAAKRKISQNVRKKDAKKRKIGSFKSRKTKLSVLKASKNAFETTE